MSNDPSSLYVLETDGWITCNICSHRCHLKDGKKGICGVRVCHGKRIESLVYGRIIAEHVDPVEKKPLYHVLPGSQSYSIATHGCNFRCLHCQNTGISQVSEDMDTQTSGVFRSPDDVVAAALARGCRTISYTYVEPTVFFEFAYDCCHAAVDKGLKNIFVSNGYMTPTVIKALAPVLAAINIDLKSFNDAFYKKICGARLQPVLESIVRCREEGIWVEVTTLIIPGLNDSDHELGQIAAFLERLDSSLPWHVSGYHPAYRMTQPPTPAATLQRARQIGHDQGLRYVYAGNRPGSGGEDTCCPACRTTLISRQGFNIKKNRLISGKCPDCHVAIAGLWE